MEPSPRLRRRISTPLCVCRPSANRRRTSLASRRYCRTNTTYFSGSLGCSILSNLQVQKMEWNHDITHDILSRLSVKSLTRFKCVCKDWEHTISSPFFFKAQLQKRGLKLNGFIIQDRFSTNRYIPVETSGGNMRPMLFSFLPRDFVILASCNGLICCRSTSRESESESESESAIYICNPLNKQFIKLPSLATSVTYRSIALACDFDESCIETFAKFKLVKVVQKIGPGGCYLAFELYLSETGAWRTSNAACQCQGITVLFRNKGIYIRGVFYWLTYDQTILVFDVEKELAQWISWPPGCESDMLYHLIGESEGSLHHVQITLSFGLRVWFLGNYSDGKWTLKYSKSVDMFRGEYQRRFPNLDGRMYEPLIPLGFKDSVLLLKVAKDVIVYDVENNKMAHACFFQDLNLPYPFLPLSNSIFPFHELGSTK